MSSRAPGRALELAALALGLTACRAERSLPSANGSATALQSTPPATTLGSSAQAPPPEVDLWFGGDVHWGSGRNVAVRLAPVADLTGGSWGFVNLEGPATSRSLPGSTITPDGKVTLSNDAAFLPALREVGGRFIGVANNHATDLGADGIGMTRRHLSEVGLEPIGGSADVHSTNLAGVRVHLAAYDLVTSNAAERHRELTPWSEDGMLIVALHETGPPSYLPSPRLRAAVEQALELGAEIVVSHGTHALGPFERRGNAVIAWGLGNLLFDCTCTAERDGALLHVRASANHLDATVIPIDAGLGDAPVQLSHDPALIFDLLESIGSSPLIRKGDRAAF